MMQIATLIHPNILALLQSHPLYKERLLREEPPSTDANSWYWHQTEWIGITGASSSGKSTLIDRLKKSGRTINPESATRYFKEQKLLGRSVKDLFANPQATAKTKREIDRRQFMAELNLDISASVYLDRAFPDQIYFDHKIGLPVSEILHLAFFHRCREVFILDRLPYVKAEHRVEHQLGLNDEELERDMRAMDKDLEQGYRDLGYAPIRIPVMSVDDRLDFILSRSER